MAKLLPPVFRRSPAVAARTLLGLCLLGLLGLPTVAPAGDDGGTDPSGRLLVLSYHDVVETPAEGAADPRAVTTGHLVAHLEWLRGHGWEAVSLDQVLAAHRGGPPLPQRAVLLTFDDGLRSFRTRVVPLLRAYHWPAVLAVVTCWLDVPEGETVPYGDRPRPRGDFLSWEELRRLDASPRVEVISQGHDLHRSVPANPRGDRQPAAIARIWRGSGEGYETEAAYRRRLRRDLGTTVERFQAELGRPPRALAWPYGESTGPAVEIAREAGLELTFSLAEGREDGGASPGSGSSRGDLLPRVKIDGDAGLADFVSRLRQAGSAEGAGVPRRSLRLDLESLHHPDPRVREERLERLLERVRQLGVTVAHLEVVHQEAVHRPRGGVSAASSPEAFFPTAHLPLRSDLLNHTVWQLRTRLGVLTWAVLPADLPDPADVARDLGRAAPVAGVVFEGGASREELSRLGRAAARVRYQRPRARWAVTLKSRALEVDGGRSGRVPPAEIVERVRDLLKAADRVVLQIGEGRELRPARLHELGRALVHAGMQDRVLVELPPEAATERLVQAMRRLQRSGMLHFGLAGSGDFGGPGAGAPDEDGDERRERLERLTSALSVETWPYRGGWRGPVWSGWASNGPSWKSTSEGGSR